MVRHIRQGEGRNGLVLANGGNLTYQHVVCLSNKPRADGSNYPDREILSENLEDEPHPVVEPNARGEAIIEVTYLTWKLPGEAANRTQTYTVQFERDGSPSQGFIVARMASNNHRVLANEADEETLKELASTTVEQIGKRGWVMPDPTEQGRTLFTYHNPSSRL
jgi:hypothetical protein